MDKQEKVKFAMVGQCPRCGKKYVRVPIVDAAACMCRNPDAVLVPLQPALIVSARTYAKFARISKLSGVPLEQLVSALLEEAARQKLEELKTVPQMIITTR
jgi:hypothetical protein